METTERIVESYVRYVKKFATIPNIRCDGQSEIDLLAIDPVSLQRYHIETTISISQNFRKITAGAYDPDKAKQRLHQSPQRRTIGFFIEKKFGNPQLTKKLEEYGFRPDGYQKVIVAWEWEEAVADAAKAAGIILWDFREINRSIAEAIRGSRQYFADDTLRTLSLFIHANEENLRISERKRKKY